METHTIPGYVLFPVFVVFFVVVPFLLGCWWAGARVSNIDRQNPKHIFTLAALILGGAIVAAILVQTHLLSGTYTY